MPVSMSKDSDRKFNANQSITVQKKYGSKDQRVFVRIWAVNPKAKIFFFNGHFCMESVPDPLE